MNLESLRDEINNIDEKLVELFEKRMEIVYNVAKYKKENKIPILNSKREEEVIRKNISKLKNKEIKKQAEEFFIELMKISRKFQAKKLFNEEHQENVECNYLNSILDKSHNSYPDKTSKVGFQGVKGSFSEEATSSYFREACSAVCYENFKDVFEAIKNDEISYGVLPIENSSTGSILDVYDLLRKYGLYIVGEESVKVNHNLLSTGDSIENIKEVYSHTQGFKQSNEFLGNYPQWMQIPYYNTAISAKYISKKNDKTKAAIASKRAAKIYGLNILKENINHNSNNYTRFIIVGKKLEINKECNKISIVCSLPHKIGSLHNILMLFAENNLNMLKIESRPIENKSWEYFFYIDFEGSIMQDNVKKLMISVEENSSYLKLLGNYKAKKQLKVEK